MPATKRGPRGGVQDRADDFAKAFYGLKMVFAKYEKHLRVTADTREKYYLETRSPSYNGKPLFFGAVLRGRAYVSFHLMPIYMNPKLQATISPELKKRMQGKSCFNFTHVEPGHIAELKKLARAGFEEFKTWGQKFGSAWI